MKNGNYHRKGFGLKDEVEPDLVAAYESNLIARLKEEGNSLTRNGITIRLANAFGFCWGVDRAVSMAYETRRHFPERRIWITNEIIHNPLVNSHLAGMDIDFLPVTEAGGKDLSGVNPGDVVIVPAFGASVEEMRILESLDCEIVDTTCPWVSRVWNRVIKYGDGRFTAIIHGKYDHEETIATSSRAMTYLVVQNLSEARWVCRYILEGGSREEFLAKFAKATSTGFDPDRDLERVGIANQTTMLKGETEQIGKLFEKTMLSKFGPGKLDDHFLSPGDTICDATQERQDAMLTLVEEPLELMIVIGGFNSSNTGHLREIAETRGIPAYHIDGPDCIISPEEIMHKPHSTPTAVSARDWLPPDDVVIGITAGASTPNQVVAEVIERLFSLRQSDSPVPEPYRPESH
ncbi:MAG: 4-hydroxy-3-methylbut-2-enyl diphosphate reductase [Candidatus Melainabacteria bacterium]|nr:4-hydroxy-3-methylbut-2-enyl diphosphate reductase [Candidatus Melainabacteria bacterium]